MRTHEIAPGAYYTEKKCPFLGQRKKSSGTLTFRQYRKETVRESSSVEAKEVEGAGTEGSAVSHGTERVQ